MKEPTYRWQLSPSKFEAAKGCACFEEDYRASEADKQRGTDLHEYMEHPEWPLDNLDPEDADQVQFCRDFDLEVDTMFGPYLFERRELYIPKSDVAPGGKLDRALLTEDGTLIVKDYKFGTQAVPPVTENIQIKSYLLMFFHELKRQASITRPVTRLIGIVCQPHLELKDVGEIPLSELPEIEILLKAANNRVIYPFKEPDPSDAQKCARCKWMTQCPAVNGAVVKFIDRANLLPMPERFEPSAIVSERDRVIAQELATIFASWATLIKANNKEYALTNGGTLAGIYNISQRTNGYEVTDLRRFAKELVDAGLMEREDDILNFVKLAKGKLVEGLITPENSPAKVKAIVSDAERDCGAPKAPITVFRKGGKKQIAAALELHQIPMIENPFKKKDDEE